MMMVLHIQLFPPSMERKWVTFLTLQTFYSFFSKVMYLHAFGCLLCNQLVIYSFIIENSLSHSCLLFPLSHLTAILVQFLIITYLDYCSHILFCPLSTISNLSSLSYNLKIICLFIILLHHLLPICSLWNRFQTLCSLVGRAQTCCACLYLFHFVSEQLYVPPITACLLDLIKVTCHGFLGTPCSFLLCTFVCYLCLEYCSLHLFNSYLPFKAH